MSFESSSSIRQQFEQPQSPETTHTTQTFSSVVGDVPLATVSYDITGKPVDSSNEPVIDVNAVMGARPDTFETAPPIPIIEPVAYE